MSEWIDYGKQTPDSDGRYLIAIADEILASDYAKKYGFSCANDGCAFIQEYITHWQPLPQPPQGK